jgi:hypothetical protein
MVCIDYDALAPQRTFELFECFNNGKVLIWLHCIAFEYLTTYC